MLLTFLLFNNVIKRLNILLSQKTIKGSHGSMFTLIIIANFLVELSFHFLEIPRKIPRDCITAVLHFDLKIMFISKLK